MEQKEIKYKIKKIARKKYPIDFRCIHDYLDILNSYDIDKNDLEPSIKIKQLNK